MMCKVHGTIYLLVRDEHVTFILKKANVLDGASHYGSAFMRHLGTLHLNNCLFK